jgi:hypothetical protein
MVLALKGTWNVTVLHRDQRRKKLEAQQAFYEAKSAGDEVAAAKATEILLSDDDQLAAFLHLYERIKDPKGMMRRYVDSREFVPRESDDRCMACLNDTRSELMHFVPMTRSILFAEFAAQTETSLHIISFLLNESNAIDWFTGTSLGEDDLEPRAREALETGRSALARIQTDYAELARPMFPLCGSPEPETGE